MDQTDYGDDVFKDLSRATVEFLVPEHAGVYIVFDASKDALFIGAAPVDMRLKTALLSVVSGKHVPPLPGAKWFKFVEHANPFEAARDFCRGYYALHGKLPPGNAAAFD